MATAISRRQFLRGDLTGRSAVLRPPWALPEQQFLAACDSCGACIRVCPRQLLRAGASGFPVVDFAAGECDFCAACAHACAPQAIAAVPGRRPWRQLAVIDGGACLAHRGVECRSCVDPCEPRAIRMSYRVGGVAIPAISAGDCSGCGACYRGCPVGAIAIHPLHVEEPA